MKTYNICWSGGIDSTFIITQLSQFPVIIRPFYIKGQTFRLSEPQELEAIKSIQKLLLADKRTKAKIMPLTIIEKDDPRIKDREIVKAHRRIYMRLLDEYKLVSGGGDYHLQEASKSMQTEHLSLRNTLLALLSQNTLGKMLKWEF